VEVRFALERGWRDGFSPWRKKGGDREAAGDGFIPYMTTSLVLRRG
jgi:hypothetical protein